jgi:ElaB/YqjD/DUF883 family membrane-anchored ribosome-binding protein
MAERLLDDLRRVMTEIETLVADAAGQAGDSASVVEQGLQTRLRHVRGRLGDLEKTIKRDVQQGARAADQYVRENAWTSVAGAAAVAFVLGVLVGRRT